MSNHALPQLLDEGGILLTGTGRGCQRKKKKLTDQRGPQKGYEGIKSLWSLSMKTYLVAGGLLSLVESYNKFIYSTRLLMETGKAFWLTGQTSPGN